MAIFPKSYYYFQFEKGYAITCKNQILEIGEGQLFKKEEQNYYLGFSEYYVKKNHSYQHVFAREKSISFTNLWQKEILNRLKGVGELPFNLVKRSSLKEEPPTDFTGVKEEKMAPYQNIITKESNLCGTYATAVLFSYLQDYENLTIPTILRKKGSSDFTHLIEKLKKMVQPLPLPTVPFQIAFGWQRFFHHYHIKAPIFYQTLGAKATVIEYLKKEQPVLLGILRVFGSSYGNHWVVAYSYTVHEGVTYYKIHDNWGNYRKIIPATLGNGLVTIKKRTL